MLAAPPANSGGVLAPENYNALTLGMSFQAVRDLVRVPYTRVAGGRRDVAVYRWEDASGSSFTARFEDDALNRLTGLSVAAVSSGEAQTPAPRTPAAPRDDADADSLRVTDVTPEGEAEAAPAGTGEGEAEAATDYGTSAGPNENGLPERVVIRPERARTRTQIASSAPPPPRVLVAGGERRARESQQRSERGEPAGSYRPKAALPEFSFRLRPGAFQVRLRNATSESAQVGIRNGEDGGMNVRLAPNAERAVTVKRGTYRFFYILDDAPYELNPAGGVTIDGDRVTDIKVTVFAEGADVQRLPPWQAF